MKNKNQTVEEVKNEDYIKWVEDKLLLKAQNETLTPNSQIKQSNERMFRSFWNFITLRQPFEDNYKQEVTITFADIERFIEQYKSKESEGE